MGDRNEVRKLRKGELGFRGTLEITSQLGYLQHQISPRNATFQAK
jgi:hypothetical protein